MASPANTALTYNLRGFKEDIADKIYTIDTDKTPFLSSLSTSKVDNRITQWQEDAIAAPNKDNAIVEGDDFAGQAITPTFMLTNSLQTFSKQIVTSGLSNHLGKYGRANEQKYQMMKASRELKTDIEAAFLSANTATVGAAGVAAKCAGLEVLANVNAQHGATGSTAAITSGVLPSVAPTDGTLRTFDITIFRNALNTMWQNGADPKACYLSIDRKTQLNSFPSIATQRVDTDKRGMASIIGAVDIYVFESSVVSFVPIYNNRIRARTLFITDGECLDKGIARKVGKEVMGKSGDNEREMLITDVTLKVLNRKGVIKVADLQ